MNKIITRDKLTDFVERMWDAGIKVDLKPKDSRIVLWSKEFNKIEQVEVVDTCSYESLINEVKCSLLRTQDPGNIIGQEE